MFLLVDIVKPTSYVLLNIVSATGIVFANKIVLSVYNFHFVYALTLIHTLVTSAGMWLFASLGIFQPKPAPVSQIFPLAAAFVGCAPHESQKGAGSGGMKYAAWQAPSVATCDLPDCTFGLGAVGCKMPCCCGSCRLLGVHVVVWVERC